jgi:hypothetical protein
MGLPFARGAMLALCLVTGCAAGELADFNAAAEKAATHYRAALSQLSVGDADRSLVELERLRKKWSGLVERFGAKRPDAFDGNELYAGVLTDISTRIASAQVMLNSRRPDAARGALLPIRTELSQMRRASGIVLLADCVLDANSAMDALGSYKDKPPDWTKPETRFDVAGKATIYEFELRRCDGMAPGDVRADQQFRRLIDGALAGLALVPQAINTRDTELLGRILFELRSFDNQLALRYG